MEREKPPKPGRYIDIVDDINNISVLDLFNTANQLLAECIGRDYLMDGVAREYIDRIDNLISKTLIGHVAIVSGSFYQEDGLEQNISKLTKCPIIYDGVSFCILENGTPCLLLKFHEEVWSNKDEQPTKRSMYTQPAELTGFLIPHVEVMSDRIDNAETKVLDALANSEFFSLSIKEQHKMLNLILTMFESDAGLVKGSQLNVKSIYYMSRHDDDLANGLLSEIYGQFELPVDQRIDFSGRYVGCIFPELIDNPEKKFNSMGDFYISGGSPFVVLRDVDRLTTYAIPVDSILSVQQTIK